MAFLRTILNFFVAGALLGVLAVTLAYPRFRVWYNTPATKALCDCAETTRQTAEALINAQMTGCAVGAGSGPGRPRLPLDAAEEGRGEPPAAPPSELTLH